MDIIDVYKSTFSFVPSDVFHWSPESNTIFFNNSEITSDTGKLSLLHEVAHALLRHTTYRYDIDLIKIESDAWQKTKFLASERNVVFNDEHAQDCLESYRSWLHKRATCPNCDQVTLESKPQIYACFNCGVQWNVSRNQLCQIQRKRL